jgi:hypothetical protein
MATTPLSSIVARANKARLQVSTLGRSAFSDLGGVPVRVQAHATSAFVWTTLVCYHSSASLCGRGLEHINQDGLACCLDSVYFHCHFIYFIQTDR